MTRRLLYASKDKLLKTKNKKKQMRRNLSRQTAARDRDYFCYGLCNFGTRVDRIRRGKLLAAD
jgi:hypothetical protein